MSATAPHAVPDELARCTCCDHSLWGFQDAAEPDAAKPQIYFTDIVCRKSDNDLMYAATPSPLAVKQKQKPAATTTAVVPMPVFASVPTAVLLPVEA